MPWIKSCLCQQEKKRTPVISAPIHLLLTPEGTNSTGSNHTFRCKVFKKPRPCHLCHQPILNQGSCCRVCKYVCHKVCESKEAADRFSDTSWQIHRQWHSDRGNKSQKSGDGGGGGGGGGGDDPSAKSNDNNNAKPFKRSNSLQNGYKTGSGESKTTTTTSSGKKLVEIQTVQTTCETVPKRSSVEKNTADIILHTHEEPTKNGPGLNKSVISTSISCSGIYQQQQAGGGVEVAGAPYTQQPRSSIRLVGGGVGGGGNSILTTGTTMDLSYVTERIIAMWFPTTCSQQTFRQGHRQAAHMLTNKHGENYMVFNLSEPKRGLRNEHKHVKEVGWSPRLAPPLERICSVCKQIESWLSADQHRIAVLHVRGSKDKLGVIVAAYMHYSSICGNAEQALDRFSMKRFLEDNIGPLYLPSNKRYVDYFAGLLSHNIKLNTAPLYLTHVTVLGAPSIQNGGCRAFLKLYEGQTPVYTSGVYTVSSGVNQFTVNVAGERNRGLQLRGDILVKCYHRGDVMRETVFSCQFHTCAVADYTLCFTKQELDGACNDPRFAADGAIELHFSAYAQQPHRRTGVSPAPTPAVPISMLDDPITRADTPLDADLSEEEEIDSDSDDVNHTFGPLDGSIYATIAKKPELSPGAVSSPLTVSMDSGISSAGHQQHNPHGGSSTHASASPPLGSGNSNNSHNSSGSTSTSHHHHHHQQVSPPLAGSGAGATSSLSSPPPPPLHTVDNHHQHGGGGGGGVGGDNNPHQQHRELDDLLADMMLTVQSIPDVQQKATSAVASGQQQQQQQQVVRFIDDSNTTGGEEEDCDDEDIPYHARLDSRPFSYGVGVGVSTPVDSRQKNSNNTMITDAKKLSSPSLVRKAVTVNKSSGDTLHKLQTNVYHTTTDYNNYYHNNNNPNNYNGNNQYKSPKAAAGGDSIDAIFTEEALRRSATPQRREYYGGNSVVKHSEQQQQQQQQQLKRSSTESTLLRRNNSASGGYSGGSRSGGLVGGGGGGGGGGPFSDSESLSPPSAFRGGSSGMRSPEFHEGHTNGGTNLTWLQTQQQKLRERQDNQLRRERQPYENRLMTELRSTHQMRQVNTGGQPSHYHGRPTASHRLLDGYTSDTTAFADDDDDFSVPLHINTRGSAGSNGHHQVQVAPQQQMQVGNGYGGGGRSDRVRPFVDVKRAHAQTSDMSPSAALAANPLGQILVRTPSRGSGGGGTTNTGTNSRDVITTSGSGDGKADSGLLSMVDKQTAAKQHYNNTMPLDVDVAAGNAHDVIDHPPYHHQHYTNTNECGNNDHLTRPRNNNTDVLSDLMANLSNHGGGGANTAPTVTSTVQANLSNHHTAVTSSSSLPANTCSNNSSPACQQYREDTSYTTWRSNDVDCSSPYSVTSTTTTNASRPQTPAFPVATSAARTPYTNNSSTPTVQFDLPPRSPTTQRKDRPTSPHHPHQSFNGTSTPDYFHSRSITTTDQQQPQQSPRSPATTVATPTSGGAASPYGNSRRSSVISNNEQPQEVSPAHVKFVRDTSRFWYKPTISRDEAINMIRDQPVGTFVVRDSNSFQGAFGLAVKVSAAAAARTPTGSTGAAAVTSQEGHQQVRHFLIEPTARGVRIKGCANEPVFSSLSALVYQHSLTQLAFPCQLRLPDGDLAPTDQDHQSLRTQQLLAQGASCNVLYLYTVDMESLTGPHAVRKGIERLYAVRPPPTAHTVHFKVNAQGITLTDNTRKLFFRRHYPVGTVTYCEVDEKWVWPANSATVDGVGTTMASNIFGFIAKKHASHSDNQCHLFAELDPAQPATAIVTFINRILATTGSKISHIV